MDKGLPTTSSIMRNCHANPTAASIARCVVPSSLSALQRASVVCPSSEKQVQTEEIRDEQFLSAALRKCTKNCHKPSQIAHSEPDDILASPIECTNSNIRRTASSIELDRMPVQRCSYQSERYTLQPPVAGVAGIVPGTLNQFNCWIPLRQSNRGRDNDGPVILSADRSSKCSSTWDKCSPQVFQMLIPEITDVDPEPQLNEPLSSRSVTSQTSKRSAQIQTELTQTSPIAEHEGVTIEFQLPKKPIGEGHMLLTEEQRILLLETARNRKRQLNMEYNRLPLSMSTLRVRNLKIQLEQQLDLVENDLRMLSGSKVYVIWPTPEHTSFPKIIDF
ncbi:uncharacterized protein LOC115630247 [Scaptodrosophila lebanonensis]|uniref:Uncharacterized protein LOC115630247 n=1 Tax=Drosophila lebanonensis TaxID=7225 RepID=A0A6J2U411_DROLE|nr:uncharacterized protein LOC115630247 [Scaptodrosophila lebanonensis]